jgi:MYXO-CTERM domain-containing protein
VSAEQPPPNRHVEPLDVDAVRTVQIGTALWAVALVATLIARDALEDQGRTWWIWTCAAGVVLGILGLLVTTRRRRRIATSRSAGQKS